MSGLVLLAILVVATFDVVVGARMLVSPRPYEVNGAGTLWSSAAPDAWAREPALLESVYRRLGAFSLHAGVATAVWALLSRDDGRARLALLATYTVTGLAFFHGDRKFFRGTRYFVVKQALGALWSFALIAQIVICLGG